jgi:hypothetical protein
MLGTRRTRFGWVAGVLLGCCCAVAVGVAGVDLGSASFESLVRLGARPAFSLSLLLSGIGNPRPKLCRVPPARPTARPPARPSVRPPARRLLLCPCSPVLSRCNSRGVSGNNSERFFSCKMF